MLAVSTAVLGILLIFWISTTLIRYQEAIDQTSRMQAYDLNLRSVQQPIHLRSTFLGLHLKQRMRPAGAYILQGTTGYYRVLQGTTGYYFTPWPQPNAQPCMSNHAMVHRY
jgi:hypothetical protein